MFYPSPFHLAFIFPPLSLISKKEKKGGRIPTCTAFDSLFLSPYTNTPKCMGKEGMQGGRDFNGSKQGQVPLCHTKKPSCLEQKPLRPTQASANNRSLTPICSPSYTLLLSLSLFPLTLSYSLSLSLSLFLLPSFSTFPTSTCSLLAKSPTNSSQHFTHTHTHTHVYVLCVSPFTSSTINETCSDSTQFDSTRPERG